MSDGLTSIQLFNTYFLGLFSKLLKQNTKASIAYKKLLSTSFDIQETHRYSYKSLLSGIKQVIHYPIQNTKNNYFEKNNSSIIYDVSANDEQDRTRYLNFYNRNERFTYISSQSFCYFDNLLDKLLFFILSLPIQCHMCIYGLFKKDLSGLRTVLRNILITRNVIKLQQNIKFKKIYIFSIYDTNSAFLSYSLMKNNVNISQITSEVPLYKWNQYIVTNELILGTTYQLEELKRFKSTIKFDNQVLFGPENSYKTSHLYLNPQPKNNRLGFYSTGGWVRNKLNHIDQGTSMEAFENEILQHLNSILSERKDILLVIYPHPRERIYFNHSEKELMSFYKKYLPDANITLSNSNKTSNECFDDEYIAVCYMTTLIFERAHAKRQSAILYYKEKDFPLTKQIPYLSFIDNQNELKEFINSNYNS